MSIRLNSIRTAALRLCRGSNFASLPQIVSGAAAKQRPVNSAFMAHQARNNPELRTDLREGADLGLRPPDA